MLQISFFFSGHQYICLSCVAEQKPGMDLDRYSEKTRHIIHPPDVWLCMHMLYDQRVDEIYVNTYLYMLANGIIQAQVYSWPDLKAWKESEIKR